MRGTEPRRSPRRTEGGWNHTADGYSFELLQGTAAAAITGRTGTLLTGCGGGRLAVLFTAGPDGPVTFVELAEWVGGDVRSVLDRAGNAEAYGATDPMLTAALLAGRLGTHTAPAVLGAVAAMARFLGALDDRLLSTFGTVFGRRLTVSEYAMLKGGKARQRLQFFGVYPFLLHWVNARRSEDPAAAAILRAADEDIETAPLLAEIFGCSLAVVRSLRTVRPCLPADRGAGGSPSACPRAVSLALERMPSNARPVLPAEMDAFLAFLDIWERIRGG